MKKLIRYFTLRRRIKKQIKNLISERILLMAKLNQFNNKTEIAFELHKIDLKFNLLKELL